MDKQKVFRDVMEALEKAPDVSPQEVTRLILMRQKELEQEPEYEDQ